jgi:multimeric flavodoxin WrbA
MKAIAVNGSPRKKWNTATLLDKALEGAASMGAETELIHLYDLNYKGCISCFSCKLKEGKSYGHCAVKDDLKPVLEKIEEEADALILGSPIYFGMVTGMMRAFMERLLFQYLVYDSQYSSLFSRTIASGFIYTMNVTAEGMKQRGYEQCMQNTELAVNRMLRGTAPQTLYVNDTLQFKDYSKYVTTAFSAEAKAKRRQEEFPKDCQKAFELGRRLLQPESGKNAP